MPGGGSRSTLYRIERVPSQAASARMKRKISCTTDLHPTASGNWREGGGREAGGGDGGMVLVGGGFVLCTGTP